MAFTTYDCADAGAPHDAAATFRSFAPLNGSAPAGFLVSSTRQGVRLCSDNPPAPGGAKYPFTSITRFEPCVTNTEMSPLVRSAWTPAVAFVRQARWSESREAPVAQRCSSVNKLVPSPECCRDSSTAESFCSYCRPETGRRADLSPVWYPPAGTAPWDKKTGPLDRCPAQNTR